MSTTTITQTEVATILPQVEHKVFVGNLSFKTTKETLTNFAQTSAQVSETTIITRGTRSLGYGFIKFESEKDAEKAAKDLNKQTLDGREINVEVARPKPEESKKTRKANKTKKTEEKKELEEGKAIAVITEKVIKKKETLVAEQPSTTTSDEEEKSKKSAAARKKQNKKNKKRQNKKKSERPPRLFSPSKTTLFVANIPYATTDDDLTEIFKDYKLVSAHIARMKNGRSKGYGFVEFENEEDQLKALNNVKDVVLDTRAIYLKIALSEQKTPTSEDENPIDAKAAEGQTKSENSKKTSEVKAETQKTPETKTEPKADKPKAAETKAAEIKAPEAKSAEVKTEKPKAAEVKAEAKAEKPKAAEAKAPEVKTEQKPAETKTAEVKAEAKTEKPKAAEVKAPEVKAEGKTEAKTEKTTKKDEPAQVANDTKK